MSEQLGAILTPDGATFSVWSPDADALWLCLFDGDLEQRISMRREGDIWRESVRGVQPGQRYGFRAEGAW